MNKFYIVSGMSGAGKSQALKVFEDFGFVCVDNMPLQMVVGFADLCLKNPSKYKNTVISIDSRAGKSLDSFFDVLNSLKRKKINYKIIFFNAADSVLIRRYSETRRRHPLGKSVLEGISLERKMLDKVFGVSDEIIDTSNMTMGELKETISKLTGANINAKQNLNVSVVSFGYKYGIPNDADIVYDVRFITNPNYVHGLKFKTGKDKAVKDYIVKQKEFGAFFNIFSKLIAVTLPGYIKEGKSYLTIAIGCTGGRHRSVFTAEKLSAFLRNKKYKVKINHRDILRSR
ncbi:RNase adapter RapZ [Endomicrobium proavitum]|uniref:Putative P-loop-containing kinase n=1 Tax=Endomicrobium proavitum TaxID=1408281 RepID=A0A0G3WHY7_9BACT|nr:RNase adapter RapZ [Endomicrobium proavitum]AKL97467.1 putative P-loop-containing kinase [Endomicrobium proavitum]